MTGIIMSIGMRSKSAFASSLSRHICPSVADSTTIPASVTNLLSAKMLRASSSTTRTRDPARPALDGTADGTAAGSSSPAAGSLTSGVRTSCQA